MPKLPLTSQDAFRRQNLLIEFASLKYACPQGIYMSLSPHDPILWWGVMFVRKGPYASAILKFTVLFPTSYPTHPPIITFLSDVYHPLVVPSTLPPGNTNHTFPNAPSSGKSQKLIPAAQLNYNQNISNLPAGSFTLKHGFPTWYSSSPRTTSSSGSKKLPPNPPLTPIVPSAAGSTVSPPQEKEKSILQVLHYLKSVFSYESVLDDIPTHLAANLGAWRAWRSFRDAGKEGGKEEGKLVWQEKVSACVLASQNDAVLYGGLGVGRGGGGTGNEEMMRFLEINDEEYQTIKEMIANRGNEASLYTT
ncbi:hypothetical protein BDZ91DRAFT_561025 [Kalaharituber pfeilii]|nr:hypothetical protein BDZ91DRAFT_561025 [Kalaharituber pfeilii]